MPKTSRSVKPKNSAFSRSVYATPYGGCSRRIASRCIGSESTRTPSMSKMTAVNRRGGGGGIVTRRGGGRSGRAGSPEPPEGVRDRGRARRGEELRADPRGEGQAVRVPREMLLQLDERRSGLEVGLDQPSVAADDLRFLGARHRPGGEDPGGAEGAAADHDRGAAGRADHGARVVVAPHVAVSGDRDRDGVDVRGDDLPGGEAGELL